jgi:hypothetical protein
MGKSGDISIQSILVLQPFRVCCLVDPAGEKWLLEQLCKQDLQRVCIHRISSRYLSELEIAHKTPTHQSFGSETFVRLTPLKWIAISEVMTLHEDFDVALFSDLDVYWRNIDFDLDIDKEYPLIFAQNDSWQSSGSVHYCTGIMFWLRNEQSLAIAKELYEFQSKMITSNELIPDEPAFNKFFSSNLRSHMVKYLDKSNYIIGHRSLMILLTRKSKVIKARAFHANYILGDIRKWIVLLSIRSKLNGTWIWFFGLTFILYWKTQTKIKSLLR